MSKYKKLMSVLLEEICVEQPDWEFIEQIILRYAYRDGFMTLDEYGDFTLTKKGFNLIKRVEKK